MITQRSCVILEVEKNGKVLQLLLPVGVQFTECYDALFDFTAGVKELERLDKEAREAKALQEAALNQPPAETEVV